jgi:hypothetical protein
VQIQALNSASVQKLIYLAKNQTSAESLARHLIAQDLDKNGLINLDGLKASLLVTEFGFRSEDVQEIFLYLSEGNGYFRFRDWLLEQNITLKFLLDGSIRAPSSISGGDPISGRNNTTTFLANPDPSLNDSRISASITHNNSQLYIPPPQINNEDGRLRKHNKTLTHRYRYHQE